MLSDPVAEAFGLIHRHLRVKISAVCITFSLEVMIMLNAGKFLSNSVRDQSVQWLLGISF